MSVSFDFNKPVTTDQYLSILTMIRNAQIGIASMLDPNYVTTTNAVAGTKRYNPATLSIEQYNGSSWVPVSGAIRYNTSSSRLERYGLSGWEDIGSYLKLSGGTMTGTIYSNIDVFIRRSVDSGSLGLLSGTGDNKGAEIYLYGKDHASRQGYFSLGARDGTNSKYLMGMPNGTLQWNSVTHTAWGMPKDAGTAMTVPASGGSVVATGDGWMTLKGSGGTGEYIRLLSSTGNYAEAASPIRVAVVSIPVKRGASVLVSYSQPTVELIFTPAAGTPA